MLEVLDRYPRMFGMILGLAFLTVLLVAAWLAGVWLDEATLAAIGILYPFCVLYALAEDFAELERLERMERGAEVDGVA